MSSFIAFPHQKRGLVPHRMCSVRVPCVLSCVRLFVTSWAGAHQAPLSMGFPRQGCWSGLPFPSPGYLPNPRVEPVSLASAGGFLPLSHQRSPLQHVTFPLSVAMLQAKILEWVDMLSSRGSSQPRDRTQVSHIAGDSLSAEPQGKPLVFYGGS